MQSLSEIYIGFTKNFLRRTIFYLPMHIVELIENSKAKEELKKHTNKIVFIDSNGHNYFLDIDNQNDIVYIIAKPTLLDDNVCQLLTLKEEKSVDTFNFILDKYLNQLAGYLYLFNWLHLNASSDIKDLKKEILNVLKLQYDSFKLHEEDVLRRFYKEAKLPVEINVEDIRENGIKGLSELINDRDLKKALKFNPIRTNKKESKKKRLEKLKQETVKNADEIILKKVFGVVIEP